MAFNLNDIPIYDNPLSPYVFIVSTINTICEIIKQYEGKYFIVLRIFFSKDEFKNIKNKISDKGK